MSEKLYESYKLCDMLLFLFLGDKKNMDYKEKF